MTNLRAGVLVLIALGMVACPGGGAGGGSPPHPWPPVKGQPYPDLELPDASGKPFKLSSLRGKVVIVEPIGLACPACNAYAGAEKKGGFRGAGVQNGLGALEDHLSQVAKVSLATEPDLVLVQLLLFDMSSSVGHGTKPADAVEWADHFGFAGRKNVVVLSASDALANQASYDLVPGFQVIDKKGVLRYDGSGHHPADNPYDVVLASIPDLLRE